MSGSYVILDPPGLRKNPESSGSAVKPKMVGKTALTAAENEVGVTMIAVTAQERNRLPAATLRSDVFFVVAKDAECRYPRPQGKQAQQPC